MASNIITGKGIIHGISGATTGITVSGYATLSLDSLRGSHKFELDEVKENNFDAALVACNSRIETEITWVPSGATRAAAHITAIFLTPLAKVTLAGFSVTALNGDWVYTGNESIDLGQGPGKMTLPIRKYDDGTQNASLTTTVAS